MSEHEIMSCGHSTHEHRAAHGQFSIQELEHELALRLGITHGELLRMPNTEIEKRIAELPKAAHGHE